MWAGPSVRKVYPKHPVHDCDREFPNAAVAFEMTYIELIEFVMSVADSFLGSKLEE